MKRTLFLALLMTLCLLTGLAVAEGCAICGGDAVCDTCGGLGYLEMKTLSGEMAQVACFGGCVEGKCPDCAVACDVCGSDGLCDTCGGLGYLEMKAYGSDEMLQIACTGENCDAGKCAVCRAGAEVAAVEEVAAEAVAADAPQGSYTFVEPAVEAAVREVLGKETGDITYEDLLGITELDVSLAKLTNVEDFQYMPHLTKLVLRHNKIDDLSPLVGLTNLSELDLYSNEISDLSPLAGLTNLTNLELTGNNISDLSPLAGLTNLVSLGLNSNHISDLSPLAGLTNLTELFLWYNSISDISPLSGLTNLSNLRLSGNNITDFSPIDGLKIETLTIDEPATPTPAPTATPSPYKAPIVGNDGLLVMSPEEYLGIESCDDIIQEKNWYKYKYENRGYEWHGDGTDNPVDWYRMEDYVDALVDSGYYKIVAHEKPEDNKEHWYLSYIGPGSVKRVFNPYNNNVNAKAAIVVSSFIGDINVYYSLDIITNDLEDTQYRLNKYINVVNPWSASSSGSGSGGGGSSGHWETVEEEVDCPICTFGNCSICGGDGKYERYGEVVSCDPDCSSCDGKGKIKQRKQVWVND